jgi:hypothetical protein
VKTVTYDRLVDELHHTASIDVWMTAARIAGLSCRLLDYRLRRAETEKPQ